MPQGTRKDQSQVGQCKAHSGFSSETQNMHHFACWRRPRNPELYRGLEFAAPCVD
jgi:hypothetical protein